ncbi:MAG: YkgJ family cysteine cluster protein [Thermodesulfobacteriota bacterium]
MDQLGFPDNGPFRPLAGRTFKFACHQGVACFNRCCADLTLGLTPYDVLRLRTRLGLGSGEFLEKFTEPLTGEHDRFPRVRLRMAHGPGRPCPFVQPAGCSVYEDRPGACRIYPLGRGSARGGRETFFLVKEDHCRGFDEDRTWEAAEWMKDQGLAEYNKYNDQWMEIITSRKPLGPPEHQVRKMQMFSMVSYNLDRFRDFVFGSRFLALFRIGAELAERLKTEDPVLLELGFEWLNFSLFGEETERFKPRSQ